MVADADTSVHLANGDNFEARAFDISVSEVGLASKHFLPKGLTVEMELEGAPFNLQQNIKVKGEIAYCKSAGVHSYKCGIRFLDLGDSDKEAIVRFITKHNRRKDDRMSLG